MFHQIQLVVTTKKDSDEHIVRESLAPAHLTYEIWGPLFFGSIQAFNSKFDANADPKKIVIDFMESRVSDHSALEALFNLVEKYEAAGKEVKIRHLSEECQRLMVKASPKLEAVIEKDIEDPRYHVMATVMQ